MTGMLLEIAAINSGLHLRPYQSTLRSGKLPDYATEPGMLPREAETSCRRQELLLPSIHGRNHTSQQYVRPAVIVP